MCIFPMFLLKYKLILTVPFEIYERNLVNTISSQCWLWLLASPGPRGRVIFAPFWGQVTAVIFKLMIVSSAVGDLFAR